ncbi:MAG: DUF63 family protein [Halodesulfurarchaeum sp.]
MLLPTGSTLPPIPVLVGLAGGALVVGHLLRRAGVTVTGRSVLALAPWMVLGSALYALYQIEAVPAPLAPLCSSPTVYGTTAVLAGGVWVLASRLPATERWLAGVGGVAALVPITLAGLTALRAGTLSPAWSALSAVVALFLTLAIWRGFARHEPESAAVLGPAGGLAVFAHVLDGVSTAVGVAVLQFGEQSPLSAFLLEVGAALPTAPYLGSGWVFVAVKAGLAVGLVWLLADMVREDPQLGNAALLVVTAVGLGPAAYNLILFAITGPAGV